MTRLLLAGAGSIGSRHLTCIKAIPDIELAGLIEPVRARRELADAPAFPSIEEVDIHADGVIIATPTETHADLACAAMARGWDVLVEKPLAESATVAMRIVEAAEQTGRKVLVGHHRRHHPKVAKLREIVCSQQLGRPITATLIWYMRKPDSYFEVAWRAGENGNPVRQNLIHDVDTLRWLFGEVEEVAGLGGNPVRGTTRTEHGGAVLRFASGVIAAIGFADTTPTPWGFEAATGENPNIPTSGEDCLYIAFSGGAVAFPSLTVWSGASTWNEQPIPRSVEAKSGSPLILQLEHFADVIAGSSTPLVSAMEGLRSLEATLRIEEVTSAGNFRE